MAVLRLTDEEPVLRLTDELPVLRRISSSLPVRLLLDERTVPDERELLPVITRTEELRPEPLSIRRVAPLPEREAVAPVRDELDAVAVRAEELPVCVLRRVGVPAAVRWLGCAFGAPPPHPGLPTPKPG